MGYVKDVHWPRWASRPQRGAVSLSGSFPLAAVRPLPGSCSPGQRSPSPPRSQGQGVACVGAGRGVARIQQGRGLRGVPTTFLQASPVPTMQPCWADPHFTLLTQRCLESAGVSMMGPSLSACYFLVNDPHGPRDARTSRVGGPGGTPPWCRVHHRSLCCFPRGPLHGSVLQRRPSCCLMPPAPCRRPPGCAGGSGDFRLPRGPPSVGGGGHPAVFLNSRRAAVCCPL